jgi:hypothetical protein
MAIDQTNVVDFIGIDPNGDEALLVISDHLEWDMSKKEDREHMYLLQEKINSYLRFVESGQIVTSYPQSKDKRIVIRVVAKYDMNSGGQRFFKKIQQALSASGYELTFERFEPK